MIEVQQLRFAYRNAEVFRDLSLTLEPGSICGLLGKNGAGKSTLLRNMAGLLFPKSGKISIGGHTPSHRHPAFLQEVFIVPEEFYLPDISVSRFMACNASFYPQFNREQFAQYGKEFGFSLTNRLQHLSHGQKKKVMIAFGLACNTSLLLMDEPTNGLDILSKSQFRKILTGAVDEKKCVVISTHQVKDLDNLIDRVAILDDGQVCFNEAIDRISEKLCFKNSTSLQEIAKALYSEESLRGSSIITINEDVAESKPDIEMLYKAVLTNGAAIRAVFH